MKLRRVIPRCHRCRWPIQKEYRHGGHIFCGRSCQELFAIETPRGEARFWTHPFVIGVACLAFATLAVLKG